MVEGGKGFRSGELGAGAEPLGWAVSRKGRTCHVTPKLFILRARGWGKGREGHRTRAGQVSRESPRTHRAAQAVGVGTSLPGFKSCPCTY